MHSEKRKRKFTQFEFLLAAVWASADAFITWLGDTLCTYHKYCQAVSWQLCRKHWFVPWWTSVPSQPTTTRPRSSPRWWPHSSHIGFSSASEHSPASVWNDTHRDITVFGLVKQNDNTRILNELHLYQDWDRRLQCMAKKSGIIPCTSILPA